MRSQARTLSARQSSTGKVSTSQLWFCRPAGLAVTAACLDNLRSSRAQSSRITGPRVRITHGSLCTLKDYPIMLSLQTITLMLISHVGFAGMTQLMSSSWELMSHFHGQCLFL